MNKKYASIIILIFWLFISIELAVVSGVQHDHLAYVKMWELAQAGQNPWSIENPYGPLNYLLGMLININVLAPKIFMVFIFYLAVIVYTLHYKIYNLDSRKILLFFFLVPLNFLIICISLIYGLNDTLVAGLIALAIISRQQKNFFLTGILLSLAALLKIYAILPLIFFAYENRKINYKIAIPFASLYVFGNILAFSAFGAGFLENNLYFATRMPSLLSPLEGLKNLFLSGETCRELSCLSSTQLIVAALIALNPFILILGLTFSIWFSHKSKFDFLESTNFGMILIFTFYKVVHPQFYVSWILILVPLMFSRRIVSKQMFYSFLPIVIFLEIFQIIFYYSKHFSSLFTLLYSYGGFVFFPLSIYCILKVVRFNSCRNKIEETRID